MPLSKHLVANVCLNVWPENVSNKFPGDLNRFIESTTFFMLSEYLVVLIGVLNFVVNKKSFCSLGFFVETTAF